MSKHIKYLPLVLLIAVTLKGFINGFHLEEAPILAILAGLSVFYESQITNKKFKALEEEQAKAVKRLEEVTQTLDVVKGAIASIKITSSYNKTNQLR